MMSILINGMKMPETCSDCLLAKLSATGESLICNYMLSKVPWDEKPFDCPLIEVPTPNGRLIDADEFDERIRQAGGMCEEELTEDFKDGVQTVLAMLKTQTIIIPASEGES